LLGGHSGRSDHAIHARQRKPLPVFGHIKIIDPASSLIPAFMPDTVSFDLLHPARIGVEAGPEGLVAPRS